MFRNLFANIVYVKVFENRFELKALEEGATLKTVLATTPFTTSRLLVGQFSAAEQALKKGMQELFGGKLFATSPTVLIQPMEQCDGGLSEVEERVLRELALAAGARQVVVHVGAELSDADVRARVNRG